MTAKLIQFLPSHIRNWGNFFYKYYFDGFSVKSYSQEGEDMILRRFFEKKMNQGGFYIDVGAHHPFRFSNTYFFYKKGWSGINIDATPGAMELFSKRRSRDLNLEYAISDSITTLPYHIYTEPALNTFSEKLANARNDKHRLLQKIMIKTSPLSYILDEHLVDNTKIDFMSIDVEGFDFQVINSNDWDKYRPTVILIESLGFELKNTETDIYCFLTNLKYQLFAKTINTLFFKSTI